MCINLLPFGYSNLFSRTEPRSIIRHYLSKLRTLESFIGFLFGWDPLGVGILERRSPTLCSSVLLMRSRLLDGGCRSNVVSGVRLAI